MYVCITSCTNERLRSEIHGYTAGHELITAEVVEKSNKMQFFWFLCKSY